MGASAGSLVAVGRSGRTYAVDLYIPDAAAGSVTFNPSGLAGTGSLTYWRVPEDITITDVSVITGMTAVGAIFLANGAVMNGGAIRYPVHLNTLNNRPRLAIPVAAGTLLGALNF